MVQSDFVLSGLETFLHIPPATNDRDQGRQRNRLGSMGQVERQLFFLAAGTPDENLARPAGEAGGVGGLDQRPVVEPWPFRAVSTGIRLPRRVRHHGSEGVDPESALRRGDLGIRSDGQNIANLVILEPGPELRGAAVDLVAGDPAQLGMGLVEPADHDQRQLRLRRECDVVRDARLPTPFPVVRPLLRQIQLAVDIRPPPAGRIDGEDTHLTILDSPRGPAVLTLDAR